MIRQALVSLVAFSMLASCSSSPATAAPALDGGPEEAAIDGGGGGAPAGDAAEGGWSCTGLDARSMGALGDGTTDDTAAIQSALDAVAKGQGGGVLCIDDGTYMIRAFDEVTKKTLGLSVGSNVTLRMSPGATLRAFPNASNWYRVVYVAQQSNVTIEGGTVQGERDEHTGTTGEWGHGVSILGSTHVTVRGVTARDCWGDGFNIGPDTQNGTTMSSDVTLHGVVAENNRRQGLSIVGCTGALVEDSAFDDTHGTAPQYGIDIEPGPPAVVQNVIVSHCTFDGNAGSGVGISGGTNNTITGSTVTNGGVGFSVERPTSQGNIFTGNTLAGNRGAGIRLFEGATKNVFDHNVITQTARYGIWLTGGASGAAIADTFLDNEITASSQMTSLAAPNVQIDEGASGHVLKGNVIRAGAGPNFPSYGIVIATPDCHDNQIVDDDLVTSGAKGAILDDGTGTIQSGNLM